MLNKRLAIVAGAGPGLGFALLKKFEQEGMVAVGLVRSASVSDGASSSPYLVSCDLSNRPAAEDCIHDLIRQYGAPAIVVHNPAHLVIEPFAHTSSEDFEACWRSMVMSAVNLAQLVMQPMARAGGGAMIVSGATASVRGGAKFSAFASAKFALRGLTQSLAREYQSANIHVVHTILDGIIDSERSRQLHSLDPSHMIKADDVANVYWQLAHQAPSTWTHELDLRPQMEHF